MRQSDDHRRSGGTREGRGGGRRGELYFTLARRGGGVAAARFAYAFWPAREVLAAGGGARCCVTTERALELSASYVWEWCDDNGCVWSHFVASRLTRIYDMRVGHARGYLT